MAKRPKHKTKWIVCTKWAIEDKKAEKAPGKQNVKLFWTPIGEKLELAGRRRRTYQRILEYNSFEEARLDLKRILRLKVDSDHEEVQDLKYCACEVRYVPHKMKVYKQDWFKKYVITEMTLKIEQPKEDLSP